MNFYQLVKQTAVEAGVSGAKDLVSLANPVEEIYRLMGWVSNAWVDVQSLETEWQFMLTDFTFNTVVGQGSYTPVQAGVGTLVEDGATLNRLANWKVDAFRKYLTISGVAAQMYLPYMQYPLFRDMYLFGNMSALLAPPAVITVDPAKNLVLGNAPDTVYTVSGQFYRKPWKLQLDADIPSMPPEFHMLLVWMALEQYGMFEAASEAVSKGVKEANKIRGRLMADQLPQAQFGEPLA